MKQLGLIGYPLKNGFSKAYFEAKFNSFDLNEYTYENFPIEDITAFPELLNELQNPIGFSVTIPHKESILSYLDELDPLAAKIGAVNCIKVIREDATKYRLIGFNTDAIGFKVSLHEFLGSTEIKHALVLGNGGASKAIQNVLSDLDINVLVVNRMSTKRKGHLPYEEVNKTVLDKHKLIVNCTPLGMSPDLDSMPPIPMQWIGHEHYCFDVIYNPDKTRFLEVAEAQGAHIRNGLDMLHQQAEAAWEIWNS